MVGRTIGNYKIVRSLAEGGMGTVYLAVHPAIGKKMAVKILHRHLCEDAGQVARFFQEARAINDIAHPNIVEVADFGQTDDGIVYMTMEYLEGKTLRQVLDDEGALAIPRALSIGRQIAAGLGAAHRTGVIHRDLKPGNVIVVGGT